METDVKVLTIDIGGTHIKALAKGQAEPRKFPSGPTMTPAGMVEGITQLAADWGFEAVSIGYPGVVRRGRIETDPHNLAPGWIGFDFATAFGRPVKIVNDAAMQALGNYQEGTLLFLGLGTGLGFAMVVEGTIVPMEFAHLPYEKGTYEDYLGLRGLERLGKKQWRDHVHDVVARLVAAIHPDDVVIGGGNAKKLKEVPSGCRLGINATAFVGGFRLW